MNNVPFHKKLLSLLMASIALGVFGSLSVNAQTADAIMPSDVENVKAVAADKQITLSWNVANDNVGVKGYKIYYGTNSVTKDGGSYNMGPLDAGNKITYTVADLKNGTPYYFAVTAYDAAGNESENYSLEATAIPEGKISDDKPLATDTEAPKVVKAESVAKDIVKVSFSETVALPAVNPDGAFAIKNDANQEILKVLKAAMDTSDSAQKTVLLTTDVQKAGVSYILTAGIQVKDASGNPIVSGTSDTAPFTGTDLEPKPAPDSKDDKVAPQIIEVKTLDATHVQVTFSEMVVFAKEPKQNFIITEEEKIENTLAVTGVELQKDGAENEAMIATVITDPQKALSYNLIVVDATDKAGNLMAVEKSSSTFMGRASEKPSDLKPEDGLADTVSPEDVTEFAARLARAMVMRLSWKSSLDTKGDLDHYVLYKSKDGKTYGEGVILKKEDSVFDVLDLVPGVKYFFKLTAKDMAGNESQGAVTTFTLPATGPEIALLLVGSLGIGKVLKRKKK